MIFSNFDDFFKFLMKKVKNFEKNQKFWKKIKNFEKKSKILKKSSKFEKEFMANYEEESEISLIFEYLFHILREPVSDFTSEYPVRDLVIVSDLMQHGKRFSFYSHCKTNLALSNPNKCKSFEKLIKDPKVKDYIDTRKPSKDMLKNLKVTIHQ